MEARIAALLVRRRVWLFVFSLVFIGAVASGARMLWFESSYRIFFAEDNPNLRAHDAMEAEYTKADNVAFIVWAKDGRIFTRETLAAIRELTDVAWTMPRSVRVDSITNFQHTGATVDDLVVRDLVEDPSRYGDEDLARLERTALAEPLLVGLLLSPRAHVTSVNVRLEMPGDSRDATGANAEVMAFARRVAADFEARHPNLKIHLMGQVVVNHAFNESSERDAATLVPAMFGVVILLLAVSLRSAWATVATTFIIFAGIAVTVGFAGWIGYQLNQVNVSAPVIILTLAVSDCVHVLTHYLNDLRRGMAKEPAMQHAIEINLVPVFLTSLTTSIGFVSLNTSDAPPFREMGNIVGLGVMGVMLLTLIMLPALMLWVPLKVKPLADAAAARKPRFSMTAVADFILRHHRAYAWGAIATALLCFSFIPKNDLNDDTVEYFHEELAVRQAFDFVQQNLTGVDSIAYSLPAAGPNGVYDPGYLHKLEAFAQWYRQQPEVTHVSVFTDVIKRLNRNMNGDDPAWFRVPDDRELAAQYALLYELSLPQGLDLNTQVNFDKSATRLSVQVANVKAKEIIAVEERAQRWIAEHAPEWREVHGSSISLMFAHIGQNNIYSMMKGSVIALVLISITLIVTLRSIKFGLLSLLPNAFPAGISFGLWGVFVGNVNIAVAAVFSITLGIVVDNTIHFFSKYLYARRAQGKSTEGAIRYAFATVGSALLVTTLALSAGFLVLAQSQFDVNASMGTMTAMVVALALVFDLLFLPGLLMRFDRHGRESRPVTP